MPRGHFAKSLVGKEFGRLRVMERVGTTGNGKEALWDCICVCGGHKVAQGKLLRNGETKSCGCLRNEISGDRKRLRPYEALYHKLLRRCQDARKTCTMSYVDFVKFTNVSVCHYCENPICWTKFNLTKVGCHSGINLDRKDNRKGYTKDNCLVCCGVCNSMKGEMGYGEFLIQIAKIAARKG